jgi:hypothetical protein
MNNQHSQQVLPCNWQRLLEFIETRANDPQRWRRIPAALRIEAERFDAARAAGAFGPFWQSISERARMRT